LTPARRESLRNQLVRMDLWHETINPSRESYPNSSIIIDALSFTLHGQPQSISGDNLEICYSWRDIYRRILDPGERSKWSENHFGAVSWGLGQIDGSGFKHYDCNLTNKFLLWDVWCILSRLWLFYVEQYPARFLPSKMWWYLFRTQN
jgi:hypothetical protein